MRGTRLLTATGEIPVESLNIGDVVVTHAGGRRAIRWIGKIAFAREIAEKWQYAPLVWIAKDALATGTPRRDLFLSRAHLMYLNGILIPVGNLINGSTIALTTPYVDVLQYFHVELDRHDVLLAEGAPCDSLLATAQTRRNFDNYHEYVRLYGPPSLEPMAPFAPIASFNGGRSEFKSRLRSALAPVIDIRHPIDVVRDNLDSRASLIPRAIK